MKFTVEFKTKTGYAFSIEDQKFGIKKLDEIREELGVSYLSLEKVDGSVDGKSSDPGITISEELARESGLFQDSCSVKVEVNSSELNQFTYLKTVVRKDNCTGEIKHVFCRVELDETAVLEWWKSKGYPLNTTNSEDSE